MRLKLQDRREVIIENIPTNAAALGPFFGIKAILQMMQKTGGDVATAYPVMMISVICIVNATRSQNPAPNHCAVSVTELPTDKLAVKTMATASNARTKGSGNHRSNQSESRRPVFDSQVPEALP